MSDETTIEVVLSSQSTIGNPIVETVTVVGTVPIGPRGPQGPQGDTGPQGPQGEPGAGGGGAVETVVAGTGIDVDATDPENPVVSVEAGIATDAEVTAAVAAEAALARNADNLTTGTVADARIASTIARDSEVTAAVSAHEADTTNVHGIADTSALETTSGAQAKVDAHVNDTSDAHDASAISIADAGNDFTATDVEGALAELQADHEADAADLAAHIADSSAAHAASAISYAGGTGMSATDVEAAIDELATEKANDADVVKLTGNQTVAGTKTFSSDVVVPDEAYDATNWNGSLEVPTKNAVRDKIETLSGVTDGDKGDLTVSSSGTVWTIDNDVVTFAKMQNIATARILGRDTASSGDIEELTAAEVLTLLNISAFIQTLLDDADAATARATLGAVGSDGPFLKDYAKVALTSGDITLNATAVTAVSASLDLTLTAASGDLIEYGINGILAAAAHAVTFDVYTMVSGVATNPFGAGLSASAASVQGVAGWEFGTSNSATEQLTGAITRTLVSGDVSGGQVILRLFYAKPNTNARSLLAQTNLPLVVWAKNYGAAS